MPPGVDQSESIAVLPQDSLHVAFEIAQRIR
jgi:hypothetical protein